MTETVITVDIGEEEAEVIEIKPISVPGTTPLPAPPPEPIPVEPEKVPA